METTRLASIVAIVASVLTIAYFCAFYIIDLDFWWHVAAGRVMRAEGWIQTDPFAYSRIGEPYLATQSWLAQILLSFVYDFTGVTGTVLFRILMVTGVIIPLYLLKPQKMWLFAPLATYAVLAMRPAILDRPQLFSFVIFAFCFWFALQWLEGRLATRNYMIAAVVLQILWVNLHGGAALLHLGIVGAVFLQTRKSEIIPIAVVLVVALFLSPNFLDTFSYVTNLFSDKTVSFIQEWQPRQLSNYIRWIVPCWILSLWMTVQYRKHFTFSLVVILMFGFLSTRALRHEPFFIATTMMLVVHQCTISEKWKTKKWMACSLLVGFGVMAFLAHQEKYLAVGRFGRSGFGSYEPARGAYEYIEEKNIQGPVFNTYEAGTYLLFKGYPERKVFVDGRNVDYGYAFLDAFFRSGTDAATLRSLEGEYGFTHALVQFIYFQGLSPLPFSSLFGQFDDWKLTYIDDTSVVYRKDAQQEFVYEHLTPELVLEPTRVMSIAPEMYPFLERELNHAITRSPESISIPLVQAALYVTAGLQNDADSALRILERKAPYNAQVYNLLALLRIQQERYAEAGALFEKAIAVGGGGRGASMNYKDLAWVFQQAGDTKKANFYLRKAQK